MKKSSKLWRTLKVQ